MARDRFYWQAAKRTAVEKIFDDGHFVPAVQPPGPPRPTLARVGEAQGAKAEWQLSWKEPLDDGGDEIYSYWVELSYQDDIEHVTGGADADGWSDWRDAHVCTVGTCVCEAELATGLGCRRCTLGVPKLNLMPGTCFRVRLRGRNAAGHGDVAEVSATTDQKRQTLVMAPVRPHPPRGSLSLSLSLSCHRAHGPSPPAHRA